MSAPAGGLRGGWADPHGQLAARERLGVAVRDLVRARRRQLRARHAWAGLLCGLLLASAAVLFIRLGGHPWPAWRAAAAIVAGCWALSLVAAFRTRVGELNVVIEADLRLNMKQRMSTAWEFVRRGTDDALAERLAVQAVRARLPSRSATVFPSGLGTCARLTPLAGLLLVMAVSVDLDWATRRGTPSADQSVADEGLRLRHFGERMAARARARTLPRSLDASGRVQRLGSRMESGTLSRPEALSRLRALGEDLRQQQREALADGAGTGIGPLQLQEHPGGALLQGGGPGRLLERLAAGDLGAGEASALGGDARALARLGVSGEELDAAVAQLRNGDPAALRDILERLSRLDRALQETDELANAREQVERARESLGEPSGAGPLPGDRAGPGAAGAGSGDDAQRAATGLPEAEPGEGDGDTGVGLGPDAGGARREAEAAAAPPDDGPVLRPRAEPGAGEVFVSRARVLPRASAPALAVQELPAQYAAEVEAVLAKEHYPAHYRAFIRQYFLTLSQGVPDRETDVDR